jgi:hypothetical protein
VGMNTDFFKDPVAIATLVLAFVTVFLAIGTFLTIRQNRKFREKDRKERLLNEIIEWAEDVVKSATYRRKQDRDELWDAHQKYLSSEAKCEYMIQIVLSCFVNLSNHLQAVITQLDNTTKFTEEALSNSLPGGKPNTSKLIPQEKLLREQIVVLIAEIAKLKTKDIA